MSFIDRIVQHPGRVKLTPVSGQTNVYDMVRQEGDVYTDGTLLNALNLNTQTQLDSTVETLFTNAGMAGGTYQNEVSDALAFLLNGVANPTVSGGWIYFTVGTYFFGFYNGSQTHAITTSAGSIYQSTSAQSLSYPRSLSQLLYINIAPRVPSGQSYSVWGLITSASTSAAAVRLMSNGSRTSASYPITACVVGKI